MTTIRLGFYKLFSVRQLALPVLAAMVLSLSGCVFFPKEEEVLAPPIKEPEQVTYNTIEVKLGTIEDKITCMGYLVSVDQKDLYYTDTSGRLKKLYVSPGDTVKKGEIIAELETGSIQDSIKFAEIDLKKSQIVYNDLVTQMIIEGDSVKSKLELAELDVEADQLKLGGLKRQLEESRIVSPVDGDVVFTTETKPGRMINAYDTVARIADPKHLQLQYSEEQVPNFKLGMEVDIQLPDRHCTGVVVKTPQDMPSDATDLQKKSIMISVKDLPDNVTLGQPVTFQLTLKKRDNTIVLPKNAMNTFATRNFVNVLKNGIREERDVEVGIISSTEVEILKGLDVGDKVIIN